MLYIVVRCAYGNFENLAINFNNVKVIANQNISYKTQKNAKCLFSFKMLHKSSEEQVFANSLTYFREENTVSESSKNEVKTKLTATSQFVAVECITSTSHHKVIFYDSCF